MTSQQPKKGARTRNPWNKTCPPKQEDQADDTRNIKEPHIQTPENGLSETKSPSPKPEDPVRQTKNKDDCQDSGKDISIKTPDYGHRIIGQIRIPDTPEFAHFTPLNGPPTKPEYRRKLFKDKSNLGWLVLDQNNQIIGTLANIVKISKLEQRL